MASSVPNMSLKRKRCKCTLHDTLVKDDEYPKILNLDSGKKVKSATRKNLITEKAIGPKCKYICEICVAHFEKDIPKSTISDEVKSFIERMNNSKYNHTELEFIAKSLGTTISCTLRRPNIKYGEVLNEGDMIKEMNKYDSRLINFLNGLCGNAKNAIPKMLYILESLYSLTDRNFVGHLSFTINLLMYYITGSRTTVDLINTISPSGSYQTLCSFLEKSCNESAIEIPDMDGVFFFDNNQILAKRWNIVYDCKGSLSAVTTVLFMVPPVESCIQKNPSFCPYLWLSEFEDIDFQVEQTHLNDYFRKYRNEFINSILKEVYEEQFVENGVVKDKVDKIKDGENVSSSIAHHKVATSTSDGGILFQPIHVNPYSDVSLNVEGKCDLYLLDPIFNNPCSFRAVSAVFDEILDKHLGEREWVAMGCDGLPYILGSKIIENHFICSRCKINFKCKKEFVDHTKSHAVQININSCKKYGKILLVPGLGHYEINYTKAIFKLLWDVFLCSLAKLMGFKSPKALQNCKKALNHHKSWQLLEILLKGNAKELVLPYVRHCLLQNEMPNVESFYNFIKPCGPNFIFMFKCTFTFLLALKLFRSGVRNCDHEAIQCAMNKLSSLFYGLNMTTYMEIDIRRNILESKCPDSLRKLYKNLCCMSRSGLNGKAEGGDFILEAFNRKVKMFMPPGPATTKRWLRAYRNLPLLEKMKHNLGISFQTDYEGFRNICNDTEIIQWRKKIRATKYISDNDKHKSIEGEELDPELISFDAKCQENRMKYCKLYPGHYKCEKIFITPSDRSKFNDITSKTKTEISELIEREMSAIMQYDSQDIAEELKEQWKEVKKRKKCDYLQFYKDICQVLEEIKTIEEENEEAQIVETEVLVAEEEPEVEVQEEVKQQEEMQI